MSEAESKAKTAAGGHGSMPAALKAYWSIGGKGGDTLIRWGEGGDYDRCVVELSKHVNPAQVHGLCGNLHESNLHISTAEHKKLLSGGDSHSNTSAALIKTRPTY